jgi:hypothetical protein
MTKHNEPPDPITHSWKPTSSTIGADAVFDDQVPALDRNAQTVAS